MRGFALAEPMFGGRLGVPVLSMSRRRLGQGCIEPSPDGSGGCRDVVPCPKGPAVSNNPDGAAGPGQGRRYTLVDYKTGELIKPDVGDEIWQQYSVTSLPDAWVCEDPRCKPYCGTTQAPPVQGTAACPNMTHQEWLALVQAKEQAWNASGQKTVQEACGVVALPDQGAELRQDCFYPDGTRAGTNAGDPAQGLQLYVSCADNWARRNPPAAPAPAPTPAPIPTTQTPATQAPQGPIPISIDIQAFTPAYMQRQGMLPAAPPAAQPRPAPLACPTTPGRYNLVDPVTKQVVARDSALPQGSQVLVVTDPTCAPPAPAPAAPKPDEGGISTGTGLAIGGGVLVAAIAAALLLSR